MSCRFLAGLRGYWQRVLRPIPATTEFKIDQDALAVARPGDVVVISLQQKLNSKERDSFIALLERVREAKPDLQFLVVEGVSGRALVVNGAAGR